MSKKQAVKFSKEHQDMVENALIIRDYCKNSFFWRPAGRAAERRENNNKHSSSYTFTHNGMEFHIVNEHRETCSNVYHTFSVTIDGVKRTAAALKKYMALPQGEKI